MDVVSSPAPPSGWGEREKGGSGHETRVEVVSRARLFRGEERVWSHSYSLLVLHDQHACSCGHIIKLVCRCKL